MYGIICSKDRLKDVLAAVSPNDIFFERSGTFSSEGFIQACQSAASIELKVLIVDMDCTDEVSLVRGIRIFREHRLSRIILLAPGRKPGDPTITTLLPMNVWDIIAPDLPDESEDEEDRSRSDQPSFITMLLQRQLATPPSYGNAARWDVNVQRIEQMTLPEPAPAKEKEKTTKEVIKEAIPDPYEFGLDFNQIHIGGNTKKSVVYETKIVGTIVIAIGGPDRRTGATFSAIQIASILADWGHKVALFERNDPSFSPNALKYYVEAESLHVKNGKRFRNFDIFPDGNSDLLFDVVYPNYDYIVLDLGQIYGQDRFSSSINLFLRANVQLVTSGESDGDFDRLTSFIGKLRGEGLHKPMNYLLNFTSAERHEVIESLFTKKEREEYGITFYLNEFISDVRRKEPHVRKTLEGYLRQWVPIQSKSKWKLFRR